MSARGRRAWMVLAAAGIVGVLVLVAIQQRNANTTSGNGIAPASEGCQRYEPPQPIAGDAALPEIAFVRSGYFYDQQAYAQALATLSAECLRKSRDGKALQQAQALVACLSRHNVAINWSVDSSAPDSAVKISGGTATIGEQVTRDTSMLDPASDISSDPLKQPVQLSTDLTRHSGRWIVTQMSENPPMPGPC